MKKIALLFAFIAVAFSVSAQDFSYTVTTTADCTNRTAEFKVPAGKVAKLVSMSVVPSWVSCEAPNAVTNTNYAQVMDKGSSSTDKSSVKIHYKKTVEKNGTITESFPVTQVKLEPGIYIIEVSKAANLSATLKIKLL